MEVDSSLEKYFLCRYGCFLSCCQSHKSTGKVIRTLLLIFNILLWFAGCAVISIAVWILFIDHSNKTYYATFPPLTTALYVLFAIGLLFLVISFVGWCGTNSKSKILLWLMLCAVFLTLVTEIIGLTVVIRSERKIGTEAKQWYENIFMRYPSTDVDKNLVDRVQKGLKCCGLEKPSDFRHHFENITTVPSSCSGELEITPLRITKNVYSEGCLSKVYDEVTGLLRSWPVWFPAAAFFLLQSGAAISTVLYLLYLRKSKKLGYDDDEDDESSALIESTGSKRTTDLREIKKNFDVGELPHPKLFRVVRKSSDEDFGFQIAYDSSRNCHVIDHVILDSNADFAGITNGSQVIEINGLLAQNATLEDVQYKMQWADTEIRVLVVDIRTQSLYDQRKVFVNLHIVEGVSDCSVEYKPRLCKIDKEDSGFGFNLLYLEDRIGEFIENLTPDGSGAKAGLKIGDRIVEVNGVNVEREKSRDVVNRIRMSGNVVYLLVVDPKTDGFFRKKAAFVTASLSTNYFKSRNDHKPDTSIKTKKRMSDVQPRYCKLVKHEKEEFGLYVVIDNDRIGQVIRWVDCGGAADRAGLRIGDRIVEVNAQNVEYESHQRLIATICTNSTTADLIVVDEEYDNIYKRNKPRLCRMFKERDSFGCCIEYDSTKDGHYVEDVLANGPAERAGLKVGERVIRINDTNIDRLNHDDVINRLRACEREVVLLVIDQQSAKHYKQIAKFKRKGMPTIDAAATSISEEPVFLKQDAGDTTSTELLSMNRSKSDLNIVGEVLMKSLSDEKEPVNTSALPRLCVLRKSEEEEHGFFLAVDRDRDGQIIRRVVEGSAADKAGLLNGDRVLRINGEKVEGMEHDEVVARILDCGNEIAFTVVDERSDELDNKGHARLYKITKAKGGYGFYLWHDSDGHFVQDVTFGSPADEAGLRPGDRLIEINGVNVEEDTHEDVFYRIKACSNIVTLLAVDAKTYARCKKVGIELIARQMEKQPSEKESAKTIVTPTKRTNTAICDVTLTKTENEEGYGFHLAYSNSFMDGNDVVGGHIVHWVEKGGPADVAGLRDGDKIISVNGVNVEKEEHEQVTLRIHANGQNNVELTVLFEEDEEIPHDVTIQKENESFGFYLWFDENGHFIEDVTIGGAADSAGLKVGDRVIEVNRKNVEHENHESAVDLVREGGESVTLNVVSITHVHQEDAVVPWTCQIIKQFGSFGFCIQQDDQGLYVEYVQPDSAAANVGLNAGDRLLDINGRPTECLSQQDAIGMIMKARTAIELTVLKKQGITRNLANARRPARKEEQRETTVAILDQLLGKVELDYVVEKKQCRHPQDSSHRVQRLKTGTDMTKQQKIPENQAAATSVFIPTWKGGTPSLRKSLRKKRKRRSFRKKSSKHWTSRYSKGEQNITFTAEGDDESNVQFEQSKTAQDGTLSNKKKRSAKFHFATSGTLRWKFDETDSRRPGHVTIGRGDTLREASVTSGVLISDIESERKENRVAGVASVTSHADDSSLGGAEEQRWSGEMTIAGACQANPSITTAESMDAAATPASERDEVVPDHNSDVSVDVSADVAGTCSTKAEQESQEIII